MASPVINPTLANSLDWLLGLRQFSVFDENTHLGWLHPLPTWAWALIILGSVGLAGWSYSHLAGRRWVRITLAGLRAALVLFIIALLAGPQLVFDEDDTVQDWLLVLVDRSASMTVPDASLDPKPTSTSTMSSRYEVLRQALKENPGLFGDEQLGKDRRVEWLGFDTGTYQIAPLSESTSQDEPNGRATRIRTAVEQALQRAVGRPISGIVLMTDGQTPQSTGAELTRQLLKDLVKVFPVPVGAQHSPLDVMIARVDRPERAFINDIVPVNVHVDHRGSAGGDFDPSKLRVTLRDTATDRVLDEQAMPRDARPGEPIRLVTRTDVAGPATWKVEVKYDGQGADTERNKENNVEQFDIEMIDRPIRVLYLEGYPRWEYRYLKTMLIREKGIRSSIMLISADRAFAQEGDDPITRLPNTLEELQPYDVIIIGDVPADYLGAELMSMMRDHVASRGAAIMWIGGENENPRSYAGTPLADLLPMRRPDAVRTWEVGEAPFGVFPTPAAEALHVLRLRSDPDDVARVKTDALWPANLPPLLWGLDLGALKPTAEELAIFRVDERTTAPAVVRLRYGAGQSLYVGTDETWRWRFGRGELFFEQFWTQLVQLMGRGRLQRSGQHLALNISRRQVQTEQTVVVTLRVTDTLLLEREIPRVRVAVVRADDPDGRVLEHIDLLQVKQDDTPGAIRKLGREYEARWTPTQAGNLLLKIDDPAIPDAEVREPIKVMRPDDEMRNTAADHKRLKALAEDTGGEVVYPHELGKLTELVKSRNRTTTRSISETLWDSPLSLLLVLLLLTCEWVGRKLIKLI